MLMGDFHQFPPVGNKTNSLYSQGRGNKSERKTTVVGRAIYSQFEHVVTLTEQNRIKDQVWKQILDRSRTGDCTRDDLETIRKLVLTNKNCVVPDFDAEPWCNAVLITPRNGMRSQWNAAALRKHCKKTGNVLYICEAEDTVGKSREPPSMEEKTVIAGLDPVKKLRSLHQRIEIAKGMKAMVTTNLATEADLANGSRGEIVDIKLDPRENVDKEQAAATGIVKLRYPPATIIFKPIHATFPQFEGLKKGEIPLFPSEYGFNIGTITNPKIPVHRRQYVLTPAYAFTINKAQGQTIGYVIVDIGKIPRPFSLDPFAVYVALSRSTGRDSIRLLRDFEDHLLTKHPSEDLRTEDARLELLTKDTTEKYEAGFYNWM